ncbi:MAG TPA: hypothetical protein PK156_40135 [Polyangium sp.]|nr:hypothetical protein [Polyangium sp.]
MQFGQAADETRGWTSPERRAGRFKRGSADSAYGDFVAVDGVDSVRRAARLVRRITCTKA